MTNTKLNLVNCPHISRSELGSEIQFTIDHVQNINEIFTELDMKSLFSTSCDPFFGAILPSGELRQALFEIKPTEPAISPRVAPTGPVVPPEAPVAAPGAPYRTVDPDLRFGTPKDSTGAYAPPEAQFIMNLQRNPETLNLYRDFIRERFGGDFNFDQTTCNDFTARFVLHNMYKLAELFNLSRIRTLQGPADLVDYLLNNPPSMNNINMLMSLMFNMSLYDRFIDFMKDNGLEWSTWADLDDFWKRFMQESEERPGDGDDPGDGGDGGGGDDGAGGDSGATGSQQQPPGQQQQPPGDGGATGSPQPPGPGAQPGDGGTSGQQPSGAPPPADRFASVGATGLQPPQAEQNVFMPASPESGTPQKC